MLNSAAKYHQTLASWSINWVQIGRRYYGVGVTDLDKLTLLPDGDMESYDSALISGGAPDMARHISNLMVEVKPGLVFCVT